MGFIKRRKNFILLLLIISLAFVLRFYKLGEVPYGFYQDESAIGFNAYSILETGHDEYGKSFPLYFKSFGDYKLPIYIYSTAIAVKVFGLNEFAVRFPSALFGVLSVIALYLFTRELTKKSSIALVSSFLYSINPWSLHYNRATFEVSISLFLFLTGGYFLLKSFNKKNGLLFISGVVTFITALYTYNLTRLLAPLLFLLFVLWFRKEVLSLGKKTLLTALFVSVIMFFPFLSSFYREGGVGSATGTLIFTSAQVKAPQIELRSYVLELSPLLSKIFFNSYALSVIEFVKNVLRHLDFNFFFVSGSSHGNHGIGIVGQFYLFEAITMIMGLIYLAFKRKKWLLFLLSWIGIVIAAASLTREAPHATRSFFLIPSMLILSSTGLIFIRNLLLNLKNKYIKYLLIISGLIFVLYNTVYYFSSYYLYFPAVYAKAWRSTDKDLSLYIKEVEKDYDRIIFDDKAGFIYSSLLFFYPYDPKSFQEESVRLPDDSEGFSRIEKFGKYEFREVDWNEDINLSERVLIISLPELIPEGVDVKKIFYYPKRHIVSAVGQKIIQYPVEEKSYVVVENQ